MRTNSSIYPSEPMDYQENYNEQQRSSFAVDVTKRVQATPLTSDGRSRRTTVACLPHSSWSGSLDDRDHSGPKVHHQSWTELSDYGGLFRDSGVGKLNRGRAKTKSTDEIFLEDVQDEVGLRLIIWGNNGELEFFSSHRGQRATTG